MALSIVRKYVFLARINDQPRLYSYRLSGRTKERLAKLSGPSLERFIKHLNRPALSQEWEAAAADSRFLTQRFSHQKPSYLILLARWRMYQRGMPLDYVLGSTPFGGMNIKIRRPILIPRADTQLWVEELIKLIPNDRELKILEVGTGSGCVALLVASKRPRTRITAIDILRSAIKLAKCNAQLNAPKLANDWQSRLKFVRCDAFSDHDVAQLGDFDLIISNPPYVPTRQRSSLVAPSVRRWEASVAVLGAKNDMTSDGLDLHRRVLALSHKLAPPTTQSLPQVCLELNGSIEQATKIVVEAADQSLDPVKTRIITDTHRLPRAVFLFK